MKNALMNLAHLFVTFLIFAAGAFLVGFSQVDSFRYFIAQIIMYKQQFFLPMGIVLILTSILLAISFCTLHRWKYLKVRMKPFLCEVDLPVISEYLSLYWKKLFPEKEIQTELFFNYKQKLEIIAYLPELNRSEQKKLLKNSERGISKILRDYFDYKESFNLTFAVK